MDREQPLIDVGSSSAKALTQLAGVIVALLGLILGFIQVLEFSRLGANAPPVSQVFIVGTLWLAYRAVRSGVGILGLRASELGAGIWTSAIGSAAFTISFIVVVTSHEALFPGLLISGLGWCLSLFAVGMLLKCRRP